jgi:chromosome segregation ATPase
MNGTPTMTLDPSSLPSGPGTILAGLGTAFGIITAGFLGLRRYLSSDSVDRTTNKAQTDVITMLNQQLASEQQRSDRLQQALDASTAQIREFQQQIFDLTMQVKSLQAQISAKTSIK